MLQEKLGEVKYKMNAEWKWDFAFQILPQMLWATLNTIMAAGIGYAIASVVGLLFLLGQRTPIKIVNMINREIVEFIRSTPLLIQLFWFYYVLPFFGLTLEAFTAGVVAIGMNFGAYGAEIVRGGVLAVPKGQWEGAFALNFTPAKRMRKIIIPQIFPIILPPAANLTVELLKATALVALVTVVDLTFEAKQINAITWLSAQCFGTALLIYYIISRFFLVPFLRWLEVIAARKVGKDRI